MDSGYVELAEADGIHAQGITVMTRSLHSPHRAAAEPTLRRNLELPKGVLQKNLKTFVYLGPHRW